jgi:hypothetical protein
MWRRVRTIGCHSARLSRTIAPWGQIVEEDPSIMRTGFPFTWSAAGVGLVLALVLLLGGAHEVDRPGTLPLLTRLFISEFGFLITVGGAVWGFKTRGRPNAEPGALIAALACVALALAFALLGLTLWSTGIEGFGSTGLPRTVPLGV